ncbi:Tetratricopeptide repeat protein 36 [Mactra antiquata]
MENKDITSNDKAVLTRIFNPNLPYGDIFEGNENAMEVEEVETEAVKQAKSLETEGVKQAEAGHIEEALNSFNKAISVAPKHASSYNNRAQALRLQGDVAGIDFPLNNVLHNFTGKPSVPLVVQPIGIFKILTKKK